MWACAALLFIPDTQSASELEYGLIVLWEMLEHQAPLLESREADIFSLLLKVRNSGVATVSSFGSGLDHGLSKAPPS